MAEQVSFAAQRRNVFGKAVRRLRREGIIPGNIVVRGRASIPVQLNALDFQRYLAKHPPTTVLRLTLGDGAAGETVVVQRVEHEPVTQDVLHVDFRHVSMTQVLRARLPVRLEGDAPAVKLFGGMLLMLLDYVEIEARPADLPEALHLDVSSLAELNMALHVGDIPVPRGVKMLSDAEEFVVKVEPPRIAEEAPTAPEAAATPPSAAEAGEGPEA
jgi:large subunit ribosomal protein L25